MAQPTTYALDAPTPLLAWCRQQSEFFRAIESGQFILVGAQHILGTTASLFLTLTSGRLRPNRVFVQGKYYSTNFQTLARLRGRGFRVDGGLAPLAAHSFREAFASQAERMWNEVLSVAADADDTAIVVLDDGGTFLEVAPWPQLGSRKVVGIEQTTMGIERLERTGVHIPVVDVARSWAKTNWESPSVGEAVVRSLEKLVPGQLEKYRFGIVGIGNVGTAVGSALIKRHCAVAGYDVALRREVPAGVVLTGDLADLLEKSDLVIGCTGKDIFEAFTDEWPWKGRKIFASASSEDIELSSLLRCTGHDEVGIDGQSIDCKRVQQGDAEAVVLRGGYPINFDGGIHSVHPAEIQLTRALLLLGIAQGLEDIETGPRGTGIIALDLDRQERLVAEWKRMRAV
jgi:hypothetical protein